MKKLIFLLVLGMMVCGIASAEIIVLKSGKKYKGKIVEKAYEYIKVDIGVGIPLTYFYDEIESIDGAQVIAYEELANSAEQKSEQAVRDNPKSAEAYNDRGMAFRMNGNQEEAINYFSKAIEIEPDYAEAYGNRGLSYASSQIGNQELALADFNKAIEKNPKNGEYYFLRAMSFFELQEYDKAWDDINKAKTLGLGMYSKFYPEFIDDLKRATGRDK